jgi:PKD repeat protein
MNLRPWQPALLALGIALAAPSLAHATTTYCVHQPADACAAGAVDEGANLPAAMTAADQTNDNTVSIGPGTYSSIGGFNATGPGQRIQIIGAGAGQTILTASAASSPVIRLDDGAFGARLSGVTIAETGTGQGGAVTARTDVDHVRIEVPASATSAPAINMAGGSLTDSTITSALPFGNEGIGVTSTGTTLLERDAITAQIGVRVAGGTLTAHDLRVGFAFEGIHATNDGSQATLDGGVLTAVPTATFPIALIAEGGGDLTARSTTLIGLPAPTGVGVEVNPTAGHTSSAVLQNSIVRGFANAVVRYAGGTAANLTLGADDLTLPADSGAGGTYTPNTNVDVDPGFVDPAGGDYHLRWSSALIDAGNACNLQCQTVPDLDGLTRPIDGNGDGTAARDIGAYEYGHRAPAVTAASATPGTVAPNGAVTFSATGADPDVGDPLQYSWTFDDGAAAPGQSVVHSFATAGPHTATVTLTDPWSLASAPATATVTVAVPPVSPPPIVKPPAKDTTRPVLSKLKLSHTLFAVAPTATKTSARALRAAAKAKRKPPPPRGTKVTFKLSEVATVVLTIDHKSTSSACVTRNRKRHHSTTACTTYKRTGTITRKQLGLGTASISFSGRIGTRKLGHGTYRLRASATDPAGNKAKTSPELTFTIV